jgi:hypothetical protein
VFVKRHKVPKDGPQGSFVDPADFAVGSTVTVYGRTFFLVDCDAFTRQWYQEQLQQEQGPPLSYPSDPVDNYRETFGLANRPSKGCNGLLKHRSWAQNKHNFT